MVDLGPALEAFSRSRSRCPRAGTRWERSETLQTNNVPIVPIVPDADDVFERAAYLEFCEGLDRASADSQALREFGFDGWDSLTPAGDPSAVLGESRHSSATPARGHVSYGS